MASSRIWRQCTPQQVLDYSFQRAYEASNEQWCTQRQEYTRAHHHSEYLQEYLSIGGTRGATHLICACGAAVAWCGSLSRALLLRTAILNCSLLAPFALFVLILYALPRNYIFRWCLNQGPMHLPKGVPFENEPRGCRCCCVMYYLGATS